MHVFDARPETRMKEEKFKSINLGYFKSLKQALLTQIKYNVLFKLHESCMYLYAQNT